MTRGPYSLARGTAFPSSFDGCPFNMGTSKYSGYATVVCPTIAPPFGRTCLTNGLQ